MGYASRKILSRTSMHVNSPAIGEYPGVVPVASRSIWARSTVSKQLHRYACCWEQGRAPSCVESKYARNCFFQVLKVDVEASCLSFSGLSSEDEGLEGERGIATGAAYRGAEARGAAA